MQEEITLQRRKGKCVRAISREKIATNSQRARLRIGENRRLSSRSCSPVVKTIRLHRINPGSIPGRTMFKMLSRETTCIATCSYERDPVTKEYAPVIKIEK